MKLDVNWDNYRAQVKEANLSEALKDALLAYLDELAALPLQPNTINPGYMSLCIWWLVDEVCAKETPETFCWEIYLDLSKKWAADRGEIGQNAVAAIEVLTPLLAAHFNNDDSIITLKEITGNTVYYVLFLSDTLSEPKKYYVAPNANSLAEATFSKNAWYRAIYAGNALVGFVMLHMDKKAGKYMVWRLMIGEPFHSRGYGRKAMEAVIEYVRGLPNAQELTLSYGLGPGSPEGFYKKLGFIPTGEEDFGEVYASLSLK
ncbi:MAG: GNAT family N-acetyltransferase [Anaerolineales bacterium]|nr:GNAT family N-acetyltransferase [Anaerolineales bacterium]